MHQPSSSVDGGVVEACAVTLNEDDPSAAGAPIRCVVIGARGRLGSAICSHLDESPDVELVGSLGSSDPLSSVVDLEPDVVIEATVPDASAPIVKFLVSHGISTIIATSGWDDEKIAELRTWLADSPGTRVLLAPILSIGAAAMMEAIQRVGPVFDAVEIVEMHHAAKLDAPSGTSRYTAQLLTPPNAPKHQVAPDSGHARGLVVNGIPIHSVRLPGFVAHQQVFLGRPGEVLRIEYDAYDRSAFAEGALAAVLALPAAEPGLTYGLEHLLFRS
jgi:4-hydroxy-tetrahydrodipicolinate reductase